MNMKVRKYVAVFVPDPRTLTTGDPYVPLLFENTDLLSLICLLLQSKIT